jgi:hypothetical protein
MFVAPSRLVNSVPSGAPGESWSSHHVELEAALALLKTLGAPVPLLAKTRGLEVPSGSPLALAEALYRLGWSPQDILRVVLRVVEEAAERRLVRVALRV